MLYIGEPNGQSPYPMLEADPLMMPYPVVASTVVYSIEIAKRSIRLYMPRRYDILSSYQVIILSDANAAIFTPSHLSWIRDAVGDDGSGLVMIGGYEAFGGMAGHADWGLTAVGEALPVDCLPGEWTGGKVIILEPEHPFVASLPIEPNLEWMRLYDGNMVEVREGALKLAETVDREVNPFWVTWDFGAGRSFAISGDWTPGGGVVFMRWEYYGDFANNLMLYMSRNELPDDLQTVHMARSRFYEYKSSKAYLYSVMEFGEKFGANMDRVVEIIEEADGKFSDATGAYLDLDYESSLGALDEALQVLVDGNEVAFRLKDQAMLWIYLIEWSVVTSTFTICGVVVWTLMVRRRYYREIGSTRFSR